MPPPPLRVRLDPAAQAELERRYQTTRDAETRTRYQMVLLNAQGHTAAQVAQLTRRSPDTVRRVLKRYLAGGLDAVPHRPHPGWLVAFRDSVQRGRLHTYPARCSATLTVSIPARCPVASAR